MVGALYPRHASSANDVRWKRIVMNIATIGFVAALIIFWAIPVALVGIISNVNSLIAIAPWLSWINDIPSVILGVVTGTSNVNETTLVLQF